jgi:hypothetical protein
LITDGHFGQTGKIDESQREDIRRVDSKVDWIRRYPSITAGLGFSVFHDFLPNLVEIEELLAREVEEFTPFIRVDVWVGVVWVSSEKSDICSSTVMYVCKPFGTGVVAGRWISCRTYIVIQIYSLDGRAPKRGDMRTKGRLVTMPEPRGKKSFPTIFYTTIKHNQDP